MNVLILGSGGREHTLAWKISQSPILKKLFVAPGNAGTAEIATNLPLNILNFDEILNIIRSEGINMVVVGPEAPLVAGFQDTLKDCTDLQDVLVIGPGKLGATLEGSKAFAKDFMQRHGIPTAAYKEFTGKTIKEGQDFLGSLRPPYVLKADGLAAGKGVLILEDLDEAKEQLSEMLLNSKFGEAGNKVVIEEFLDGIELSCFVLTDGNTYKILPYAKDYKRIGEGDTGLNTGGMGAVSPVPFLNEELKQKIEDRIVKPSVQGLHTDSIEYTGFLFIGLMIVEGNPMVIEYNVRMGDPETEVVIPRIKNDFLEVLKAAAENKLSSVELSIEENTATTVMAVSGGYPEAYSKGHPIEGLDTIEEVMIFHAGTKKNNGEVLTNGGRVLAVTAMGSDMQSALNKSYKGIAAIDFEGMYYRKDIGFDL